MVPPLYFSCLFRSHGQKEVCATLCHPPHPSVIQRWDAGGSQKTGDRNKGVFRLPFLVFSPSFPVGWTDSHSTAVRFHTHTKESYLQCPLSALPSWKLPERVLTGLLVSACSRQGAGGRSVRRWSLPFQFVVRGAGGVLRRRG